jgi:Carboxypeptidase regulatory-like domain
MTHRYFVWVVVMSAASAMLGITSALGQSADGTGRVEGRVTLDSNPVLGEPVTLFLQTSAGVTNVVTDSDGRYAFESVAPGDYKLRAALTLRSPQGKKENKCKLPRGSTKTVLLAPLGMEKVFATPNKGFKVKAGKTIKRDVKVDCKPDAEPVPPL